MVGEEQYERIRRTVSVFLTAGSRVRINARDIVHAVRVIRLNPKVFALRDAQEL